MAAFDSSSQILNLILLHYTTSLLRMNQVFLKEQATVFHLYPEVAKVRYISVSGVS